MRDFLMRIWRKLTQIKALEPLIKFIRWFCGTDFFNTCLDFLETRVFHTSYDETAVFYKLNTERMERIASWFADEKSRKVYRNILAVPPIIANTCVGSWIGISILTRISFISAPGKALWTAALIKAIPWRLL